MPTPLDEDEVLVVLQLQRAAAEGARDAEAEGRRDERQEAANHEGCSTCASGSPRGALEPSSRASAAPARLLTGAGASGAGHCGCGGGAGVEGGAQGVER